MPQNLCGCIPQFPKFLTRLILHSNPQDYIKLLVLPKRIKIKITKRRKKKQETTKGGAPDIDNRDLGTSQGHQAVASDEGNGRSTRHRSSAASFFFVGSSILDQGFIFPDLLKLDWRPSTRGMCQIKPNCFEFRLVLATNWNSLSKYGNM
jgi:hypothetical protein